MKKLLIGYGMLAVLALVLAYFAQVHRPFAGTSDPLLFAFLGVYVALVAFLSIIRYFVKL